MRVIVDPRFLVPEAPAVEIQGWVVRPERRVTVWW